MSALFLRLPLSLLLFPWGASAQELPPPGGWPLRPVATLRAVPEPPGGLVPYRQGQLWGFADTTGRVWIRPVFETEPPRFGAGLLLQAEMAPAPELMAPKHRPPYPQGALPRWVPNWNLRYGNLSSNEDGSRYWALDFRPTRPGGAAFLLNARGEQLLATAKQAIAATADGGWQALNRPAHLSEQRELVAIEAMETEPAAQQPGGVFTVPLGSRPPAVPPRLLRRRAYDPDVNFRATLFGGSPLYVAQKVNWLLPHRLVSVSRDGISRELEAIRYRHHGQCALFDAKGHRLTAYRFGGMKPVLPGRLAYWHWADTKFEDQEAATASGLPHSWDVIESLNGPARRYGLLDERGREITPPLYALMRAVGPNSLWVVAVEQGHLLYGLIDTLGRYHLPLSSAPISLPDAAGLLRRYSAAPTRAVENQRTYSTEAHFPDSATVGYLRPDGRPAFAGSFAQAGAFWQGRALVKIGPNYGIIDSVGRWVLPPQPEELRYYGFSTPHHDLLQAVDPLELFDPFSAGQLGMPYYGTLPGEPEPLLLSLGLQGYGLRDARTGRVLAPARFDKRSQQWHGGAVGEHKGQPLGYSLQGQPFNPDLPASYPAGVRKPAPNGQPWRPLLERTEQGWRTRGGRQLWQD